MEICEKAREIVQEANRARLSAFAEILKKCESPVEQILLAALFECWEPSVNLHHGRIQTHFSADYPPWDGIFIVCAEPQRTITTLFDKTYRADVYVYLTRFRHHATPEGESAAPELARVIVEVDGHNYHERTKEQASYDKKRDRVLTLEGYTVLRFTGSDVYRDPLRCAEEIDQQIQELASKLLADYRDRGRLEELIIG